MNNDFKERIKVECLEEKNPLTDIEKMEVLRKFIDSQKNHFESYINFVNIELCILKDYRIVSDRTELSARIKSIESSIKNDDNKALNDVFGMEIDSATPGESAFIAMLFKDTLEETREVIHNKESGYVAYHYSGYPKAGNIAERFEDILNHEAYDPKEMYESYIKKLPLKTLEEFNKDEEKIKRLKEFCEKFCNNLNHYIEKKIKRIKKERLINLKLKLEKVEQEYHKAEKLKANTYVDVEQPIIEAQLKTIQVAIDADLGEASHEFYKGEEIERIQEEYDRNGGLPFSKLPIMYESELKRDKNGVPIPPRILSSEETAAKVYKSLIVVKDREIGGDR